MGKPLPREELLAQVRLAQSGDLAARDRVVDANVGLVRQCVERAPASRLDGNDLFQEGVMGLLRALRTFDPDRGIAFATYAVPWIKQRIRLAIYNQGELIRVPIYCLDGSAKSRGSRPGPDVARARARRIQSFVARSGDDWHPAARNAHEAGSETTMHAETMQSVRTAVRALPPAQRKVIELYYGLDGAMSGVKLRDIAERFGWSRSMSTVLHARGLASLRKALGDQ